VGYTIPEEFADLILYLRNNVTNIDKVTMSVHCHNDLGLAVSNSLSAIGCGVSQVECTVNGIGERAGNASLEELVMALKVRSDILPYYTRVKTEYFRRISDVVAEASGYAVAPNKAIVGRNVFTHESGIHQHGVLMHRGTYEIIDPTDVGVSESTLTMGKRSGRHAFRDKVEKLGIMLTEDEFREAFQSFKAYADKKGKTVSDEEIYALTKN
jgi:2-isopropylmalate synthase